MSEWWWVPQLFEEKPDVDLRHDGAPPHIPTEVTTFFNRYLAQRWLGRVGFTSWTPRSPGPTPLDLFLRGFGGRGALRFANICDTEQLEGSYINSSCTRWTAFIAEYHPRVWRATDGAYIDLHGVLKTVWVALYKDVHLMCDYCFLISKFL
jgi:hypothetical protein